MRVEEGYPSEGIIALCLVQEVGGYLFAAVFCAQKLEDRQERCRAPGADTVPFVKTLLGILGRVEVYETGTGGIHRHDIADDTALCQEQESVISYGLGGFDRVHQDYLLIFCYCLEFFPLLRLKGDRRFAQYVFASF